MKKALVALSAAVALFAGNSAYDYELTPTFGGVTPEGNLDLDEQLSYGLRFGKNLTDCRFDQIELGIEHAPEVDVEGTNQDIDITRYFINLIKEYPHTSKISFYGLVGLGYENVSAELADNENSMFGQYGLGIKHWISDSFALKADVRHALKFEDGDNNLFYTIGFVLPFGKKVASPAPAPVAYTAPEPTPTPPPRDDDGDGIPNIHDRCPNSAPGAKVNELGCEMDTDGDGVIDRLDQCPTTPKGVKVDETGCCLDTDGDGVVDFRDKCPNTPYEVDVNADGCAATITLHVQFDTDKSTIKPAYMDKIREVAEFMKTNTIYNVVLKGHTDSRGSDAYNLALSKRRANAVAKALNGLGIESKRISAEGYGETKPVATNATKEGMAKNRRVDAEFSR